MSFGPWESRQRYYNFSDFDAKLFQRMFKSKSTHVPKTGELLKNPEIDKIMGSSARAILTAKVNSHPFDDRVLLLDVPCKIGRAHKEDQVLEIVANIFRYCKIDYFFPKGDSSNGLFDCKVLSRQHAMIIYEDERFFILDTGSSNGTFVNNIRLSKTGEESKMTEIFNGDIIRFGSDIVDKVN